MIRVFNQYVSARTVILTAAEAFFIGLSVLISAKTFLWYDLTGLNLRRVLPDLSVEAFGLLVLMQAFFYHSKIYDFRSAERRWADLRRLVLSLMAGCLVVEFIRIFLPWVAMGGGLFIMTLVLTVASGAVIRVVLDTTWAAAVPVQNILILGTGELAEAVAHELERRKDLDARFAGFVGAPRPESEKSPSANHPILGSCQDLISVVQHNKVSRIIVAMEDWRAALPAKELMKLRVAGVVVEDAHAALASLTGRVWLHAMRPNWLTLFIFSGGFRRSRMIAAVKRFTDICFGVLGLILASPVMLLVSIAIWLESGRPVIYRQIRVGLRGKRFHLLKFRSMRVDAEADGQARWAGDQDPRVTRLGKYLRKFRLDELPQFFNVICGEMSFVGPRPERPFFVEKLQEKLIYYDLRHTVRPGVTGWAQVNYPYCATVEDSLRKLEYDLFYLKNMSFLFDCTIVLQTLRTVLFGLGAR